MEKDLPYSAAFEVNNHLYVSGQLPLDEEGKIPESIKEQTRICLERIESVLKEYGYRMDEVAKTTVYMTDFSRFSEMNEEYAKHFQGRKPARCACQVSALAKNAEVEIDCFAEHDLSHDQEKE